MSYKHQKVDGSTPQASKSHDKHIFVNKATIDRYYSFLVVTVLILERGIKPHETQKGGVTDMIKERGWENFTQQSEAAVITIVKEFYANSKEAKGHMVYVRGMSELFDKATTNIYYHIRDMEDEDEFTKYRDDDFD